MPGGCQTQPVRDLAEREPAEANASSPQVGRRRSGAMHIIETPIASSTWNVQRPEPSEMMVGSITAMIAPRTRMSLSMAQALTPFATRRSTLSASAVPARNTNVGAHRCVIQRVKNSAAGRAIVRGARVKRRILGDVVPVEGHRRMVDDHQDHHESSLQWHVVVSAPTSGCLNMYVGWIV